jgi:HEAT repeat protein
MPFANPERKELAWIGGSGRSRALSESRRASLLGRIDGDASTIIAALMQALRDPDPDVRVNAAWSLWVVSKETAQPVDVLISVLKGKDSPAGVRAEAARLLGKIGSKAGNSITALREASHDEAENVRVQANRALAVLGR